MDWQERKTRLSGIWESRICFHCPCMCFGDIFAQHQGLRSVDRRFRESIREWNIHYNITANIDCPYHWAEWVIAFQNIGDVASNHLVTALQLIMQLKIEVLFRRYSFSYTIVSDSGSTDPTRQSSSPCFFLFAIPSTICLLKS